MYECVILYRVKDGPVEFVRMKNERDMIAVLPNRDVAIAYCEANELFQDDDPALYQIVELDEL